MHRAIVCVALPSLAISPEDGQLTGSGLEGVYRSGRRLLARCRLRIAGREPMAVQGRSVSTGLASFASVVRAPSGAGPDPEVAVERSRDAEGTERITLRSSAVRHLRLPVEIALGTDLADLAAVAAGRPGPELPAHVHENGMRWSAGHGGGSAQTIITAQPPPHDTLASAGLLRWELELAPGAAVTLELRVCSERGDRSDRLVRSVGRGSRGFLPDARAEGDDDRSAALLETSLGDLRGLLCRDPAYPGDAIPAAGVPWRCGQVPAEALWAVRMALPVSTRLAASTLRILARTQHTGSGEEFGRLPGPSRDAGPHLPPSCAGTEATLAFPVVLAEAWRWGLSERDLAELLPTAERCLHWLRRTAGDDGLLPAPGSRFLRTETQAHAHRAALLGADLLEAAGRPGADEWRAWAGGMRRRFRDDLWIDDLTGGRPAAGRGPDGRPVLPLGSAAAHLLDTGLTGGGRMAPGLLDKAQTEQLARLLGGPALDCGWGLRSLGSNEPGHNPFGHRSGVVRVHETVVAVTGLAAAGHEKEASSLLRGLVDASTAFGHRLPEMFAGHQRTAGSVPVPHPAACRPAALAAAAGIQLLVALAGVRPDAPARTVALRPLRCAPLGALRLSGLSVAGGPFAVRIGRLGLGVVEQAAEGLQLGV
ncbi:glycogen debranching N-terminal domain-containing protein [Streptomyces sp. NPDC006283]|uniref:glycogen debranching N-terminal domain-containing protein n=1 Tax=Streptomyces sp. NPDC006283 TaxID=3156741 RepID=UPI0033AFF39A